MNYYEHHIGDYDHATAHLTACEDGIYSRLIRWYMASETPLPGDLKVIQRRVRAHSKDERAAVETVLDEFFELRDGLYHQKRCDEEIEKYQEKQSKARASAHARWDKSNMRTQCERNANASETHMRTTCESDALQTPDTRHQAPDKEDLTIPDGMVVETAVSPPVPFQAILDLYHAKLPELPRCIKLTSQRKGNIRQRWADDLPSLADWEKFFVLVRGSPFLMGKSTPRAGQPPFRATLDWLCRPEICVKVVEGKYG